MRGIRRCEAVPVRLADDEYVRRVRQRVALYDRWRPWTRIVSAGLVIACLGVLVWMLLELEKIRQLAIQRGMQQAMPQGFDPGFLIGVTLGVVAGGLVMKIVHLLIAALDPFRTERLLLRYYDTLAELAQESAGACESAESRA